MHVLYNNLRFTIELGMHW